MICTRFESEALPRLLLGESLDPHFDTCADCRLARAEYDSISDALRHSDLDDDPGEAWADTLWEAVRAQRPTNTDEIRLEQRTVGVHAAQLPSDDGDLFNRWREGHTPSELELIRRHLRGVYRFFAYKVDSNDAESLVQATFLRLGEFRDRPVPSSFRALVFGIARNVLRDHYQSKAQKPGTFGDITDSKHLRNPLPAFPIPRTPDPRETSWLPEAGALQFMALLDALRGLPFTDQELLSLYYSEDLSGIELAEVLGLSEPTVRARLRRARDRLAARLLVRAEEGPASAEARLKAVPDEELHSRLADLGARLRATSDG